MALRLTTPAPLQLAELGTSVAIAGTTAILGAPDYGNYGAVFVYRQVADPIPGEDPEWVLQAQIDAPGFLRDAEFGASVALDGEALWLLWKSDGNCYGLPTIIYAQPLTADGTGLAGDPVELIRNDLSWERDVVEGPSMIEVDGVWHLFYSANRWDTADYAVGHAVCETVTGPCVKDPEPWLVSTDGTAGPGGLEVIELADRPNDLVVYHGWTGGEVGYPDGARALYARLIRWVDGQPVLVGR